MCRLSRNSGSLDLLIRKDLSMPVMGQLYHTLCTYLKLWWIITDPLMVVRWYRRPFQSILILCSVHSEVLSNNNNHEGNSFVKAMHTRKVEFMAEFMRDRIQAAGAPRCPVVEQWNDSIQSYRTFATLYHFKLKYWILTIGGCKEGYWISLF
jgi:hypothetical protein